LNRVVYLEGRPHAHHLHRALALSLGASPRFVDGLFRWQDQNFPKILQVIAWFVNAFVLINDKNYDIILVDNLHVSPILMKKLGLLNKNKKVVCHLGSHTLFFTYANKYSKWTFHLHQYLLKNYDSLICEGKMAVNLANELAPNQKVYYSFLGLRKSQFSNLNNIHLNFKMNNILFVGNVESDFRYEYKGIDIMLHGIRLYNLSADKKLSIDIVGKWSEAQRKKAKDILSDRVVFLGYQKFYSILSSYQIYLHCSRGDAFPTSTLEAMSAGLLTVVSNWTGTKEIVEQVDNRFITELTSRSIADTIKTITILSLEEKKEISLSFKRVSKMYKYENMVDNYHKIFNDL